MSKYKHDELIEKWNKIIREMNEKKIVNLVHAEFRFIVKVQINGNKFWVHDYRYNTDVSPRFASLQEARKYKLKLKKRLSEIM